MIVSPLQLNYTILNIGRFLMAYGPLDALIIKIQIGQCFLWAQLRATSHTRLRACDHCTSSTLIGGKGGTGPSSLHNTLEGPTNYVNARWM